MNKPTQADLLGYLLGALEPDEQREIEDLLARDEQVKAELAELEEQLGVLGNPVEEIRPPTGLARRTCELIAMLPSPAEEATVEKAPVRMRADDKLGTKPGWSVVDVFVACSVCLLIAMIFLPAIAHSRFQSDLTTCQNNLRTVGIALENYSDNYSGRLIPIPQAKPYSVAGLYALRLRELDMVEQENLFFCPSIEPVEGFVKRIPLRNEIETAEGMELRQLLQQVGGDYAYTLGSLDDGAYLQPQLADDRSFQVLLADTPNINSPGLRSANHGGKGQNVLLGDFSTRYILTCMVAPGDNIYQNDNGVVAPGMTLNDSVLGGSATSPFAF